MVGAMIELPARMDATIFREDTGLSSWSALGSGNSGHQTFQSAISPPHTRATRTSAQLRKTQPGRQASC